MSPPVTLAPLYRSCNPDLPFTELALCGDLLPSITCPYHILQISSVCWFARQIYHFTRVDDQIVKFRLTRTAYKLHATTSHRQTMSVHPKKIPRLHPLAIAQRRHQTDAI
jgi:hypothetical protein